jgi:cephalosporin hydroxylase
MADPTLAQDGALKEPAARGRESGNRVFRKTAGIWHVSGCWVRYAFRGARQDVPALVDFVRGNHFFRANQVPSELTALGQILAAARPRYVLEIGTARGGTLLFLTRLASPEAVIVSVDLPGGRFGGGYGSRRAWFYRRFARRGQRIHLFRGDSHSSDMLGQVKAVFGGQPLDYLFIDGDHSYEGVRRDFEMYGPLVRKGGMVAIHDIAEHPTAVGSEVTQFWNEVKANRRHKEFIESRSQGWAGIGVLYVD